MRGRRLQGALSRSPRGPLTRLSPGVYRNAQGQLTGAGGRPFRNQPARPQMQAEMEQNINSMQQPDPRYQQVMSQFPNAFEAFQPQPEDKMFRATPEYMAQIQQMPNQGLQPPMNMPQFGPQMQQQIQNYSANGGAPMQQYQQPQYQEPAQAAVQAAQQRGFGRRF